MMSSQRNTTNHSPEEPRRQGEPSVLDWFKSVLRGRPIPLPEVRDDEPAISIREGPEQAIKLEGQPERIAIKFTASKVRLPLAILLASIAQFGLEAREGSILLRLLLYGMAVLLGGWAYWAGDFSLPSPEEQSDPAEPASFKPAYLVSAAVFSVLTWLSSSENQFHLSNMVFWSAAVFSITFAFWEGPPPWKDWKQRTRALITSDHLQFNLNRWHLAFLGVLILSIYFRVTRIAEVPPEMVSDHAEKLLDVLDVLNGRTSIFFPRNTGREALQFYMAAATAKLFGTGISYLTLKIGTVAAGLISLPYIYLLGRELVDRRVGLAAMALAGVAYWPNVISRVGLRFPLYPLFAAPAMYYIVRGIRRKTVNDFLIGGLVIGVGLHGYSPARAIPIVVSAAVGVYLLHKSARDQRWAIFSWLIAAGVVAFVVTLPLARFAADHPDLVMMRTNSRLGDANHPLPEPALLVFAKNVWSGLLMFGWDNGTVWVNSIPHRPALDWLTGALFHLGIVILVVRYLRNRNWIDLFLLLSIPLLQLPSTLSLAFPNENPATNRAAGAFIPAFIAAGIPLTALYSWSSVQWQKNRSRLLGLAAVLAMFLLAGLTNYKLVFDDYQILYQRSAWNTSEAGDIVRAFAESVGDYDAAHVVAFPYWMDTRLVGIQAGKPGRDYAIWPDEFPSLDSENRAQLFILNPQDAEALTSLQEHFPAGVVQLHPSEIEGKDLLLYFVPPSSRNGTIQLEEAE